MPGTQFLGDLNYVEHSPQYIFICGDCSLRVFSRQTGGCVYGIPSTFGNYGYSRWKIGGHRNEKSRSLNCIGGSVDDDPLSAWDKADSALYRHEVVKDDDRPEPLEDQIVAGMPHSPVSCDDDNLVDSPRLVLWELSCSIVPNFTRTYHTRLGASFQGRNIAV